MGWFISIIIVAVLCCLGTVEYAYDLYEDIRYRRHRKKRKILEDLMWLGCAAFCAGAALYTTYALWATRAIW